MRDIRNIVIGMLAAGLIWSWAGGQQRRDVVVGDEWVYTNCVRVRYHEVGKVEPTDPVEQGGLYRFNAATGEMHEYVVTTMGIPGVRGRNNGQWFVMVR